MLPGWLPKLVLFADHGGNWDIYVEALHTIFTNDFVGVQLFYKGKRVGLKRHPVEKEKEATFWHIISTGKSEADREIDFRRCERIGWLRAILDNCNDSCLKTWTEEARGDTRIHIWCEDAEFLVVLSDRGDYVLPWTAFHVVREHQKRKLLERWKRATAASGANS